MTSDVPKRGGGEFQHPPDNDQEKYKNVICYSIFKTILERKNIIINNAHSLRNW